MKLECGLEVVISPKTKEEKHLKTISFEEECDEVSRKLRWDFTQMYLDERGQDILILREI